MDFFKHFTTKILPNKNDIYYLTVFPWNLSSPTSFKMAPWNTSLQRHFSSSQKLKCNAFKWIYQPLIQFLQLFWHICRDKDALLKAFLLFWYIVFLFCLKEMVFGWFVFSCQNTDMTQFSELHIFEFRSRIGNSFHFFLDFLRVLFSKLFFVLLLNRMSSSSFYLRNDNS